MIRPAQVGDLPTLTRMGSEFYVASGFSHWFGFHADSLRQTLKSLMEEPQGCVLIAEKDGHPVGMVAGMFYRCWFNRAHQTAQELMWWVDLPERDALYGHRLREAFEAWALKQGCRTVEMGCLEAQRPERMTDHYRSLGYGPKERIFCKVLKDA